MNVPRCKKCNHDHFNYRPCRESSGLYGWGGMKIERRKEDGWRDFGDLVDPLDNGGWGCKVILPKENR